MTSPDAAEEYDSTVSVNSPLQQDMQQSSVLERHISIQFRFTASYIAYFNGICRRRAIGVAKGRGEHEMLLNIMMYWSSKVEESFQRENSRSSVNCDSRAQTILPASQIAFNQAVKSLTLYQISPQEHPLQACHKAYS